MTNPFDNLKINRQEAIDRLAKAQPVFATFQGGLRDTITAIVGDEVFTPTSIRPLADVAFFSLIDNNPVKSLIDIDDQFDDEDLETTIL